ncbi:MAG: dTMP kinase, partial [Solobacterium sp.]|nr:dTMP kinase [Solobacterium sp.]
DQESVEFHERVHEGYQKVIEKYADRMIIVDATADVDTVIQKSYEIVKGLLDAQG